MIPVSETSHLNTSAPTPMSAISTENQSAAPRLHFIDGLRGLAMVMVLLFHCWISGGLWKIPVHFGSHTIDAGSFLGNGHIGVNLFLVLSGFCLYWPFVKGGSRREPTLWEFAKKRCRRIMPPYYVTLVLFGIPLFVQALRHHSSVDLGFAVNWLLLHIFMVHNLTLDYVIRVDGALWTLALEFQLYILFPILVEAYRRFKPRAVLLTVLVASCAYRAFLVKEIFSSPTPTQDYSAGFVLDSSVFGRCFEFTLGMFAAIIVARWHTEKKLPLRWPDYLVAALVVSLSYVNDTAGYSYSLQEARWGILAAAVLLIGSRPGNVIQRILSSRVLVSLGIFSYSVYLIHQPIVVLFGKYGMRHFSNTKMVLFEIFFVAPLMIGLGYLFHLVFERPFMTASPRKKVSAAPVLPLASEPAVPAGRAELPATARE